MEALAETLVGVASVASLALPAASVLRLSSSYWALVAVLLALVLAQPALPQFSSALSDLHQAWMSIKGELLALAIGVLLNQQVGASLLLCAACLGAAWTCWGGQGHEKRMGVVIFSLCTCLLAESICPPYQACSGMLPMGSCLPGPGIRPTTDSSGTGFAGPWLSLGAGYQALVSAPPGQGHGATAEGVDETPGSSP
jgi:hypothetical protein